MIIALLSDIHANLTALESVLEDIAQRHVDSIILCGDLIDYGPRPNETISIIRNIDFPILANIYGNHEMSLVNGDYSRFSSERGRSSIRYTKKILSEDSLAYITHDMLYGCRTDKVIDGKNFLIVHGNIIDPVWGKLFVEDISDARYASFDYVISGHSHLPHYIEQFYPADLPAFRNRKRTVFINPGSVGQPRNQCPLAQYGILDTATGEYELRRVWYDVDKEETFFSAEVDSFYKDRIKSGI